MMKLFAWSVNHLLKKRNDQTIRRNERGIIRARSIEDAKALLSKSVCTKSSTDLIVVEIPDKMTIYSLGYKDSVLSEKD